MKSQNRIKNSISKKIRTKLDFPLLSSSPEKNSFNKTMSQKFNLSNKNSYISNSGNDSFIQRNYQSYLEKSKTALGRSNTKILSESDLATILFNLKKNYNLIMTVTEQGNLELEHLNNTLEIEEEKLNKLIDFKEIELPEEKISLRKLGDTNMTKEQLRNHLFELLNEKRGLDEKVNIAKEYTKTVEYMIAGEKKKLRKMQEETNQIQEKLNNYNKYNVLIKENLQKTKLKNNNYLDLSKQLQNNIDLANNIINDNNEKNKTLENRIINKEEKVDSLRQTIDFMKQQNKESFLKYKEDNYEKISRTKEEQEEKIKKEKKYIDIIYCLYILQKYFINQDIFSFNYLLSSKEYNSIINDNYEISLKDPLLEDQFSILKEKSKLMDDSSLNENDRNRNNSLLYKSSKDIFRKFNKNKTFMVQNLKSSKNVLPKSQNITLNKLKEILNDINFSKDEIFDYISKLSAKIALYQYNLNNLHGKEISLNDKKHNYFDRVKKIISENYLNFEELTKNNSRFESFLYNNEIFINEMKLKNREKNLNEINKRLNTKLESNETSMSNMSKLTKEEKEKYEQELKLRLNKEQLLNNANESYKKANDLILKMGYFFDNILEAMNNISNTIQNIIKSSKFENDENSKVEFTGFLNSVENEKEKIVEFKNKNVEEVKNDSNFYIEYIKKLIEYNKNILIEKMDEKDLEKNLLKVFFYKDDIFEKNDGIKINELAFEQFTNSSKISNQYDIFYHFYTLSDQTMKIVKSIIDFIKNNENFINKYESKKLSSDKSSKSIISNSNNLLVSIISNAKAKLKASNPNKKLILKNKQILNEKEKNDEFDSVWVEDKDTSIETKSVKNEEKLFKNKFNHIEKNIMNHLYKPSFEKTTYLRKLNLEMKNIKSLTLNNSKYNFVMNQKKNEIHSMSQQMLIYNNPGIHPNELSNPMYNNINSMMIQKRQFKSNLGKRLKSTMLKKRYKYKI